MSLSKALTIGLLAFVAPVMAQLVSIEPDSLPLSKADRRKLEESVRGERWLDAEATLFRHVRTNPASAKLRKALAAAHFRNERYLAAASEYARAARIEPLDPASRFTLATAYIALDRRHWARREMEALANEYPRNPLYPYWLAGIYQHYQWFDQAMVEVGKAIELNPSFSSAHDRLGQCLEALGRTDEALAAFAKADELASAAGKTSPWPSYHRGSLFRQMGRYEEALTSLRRATALDAKHAEAQYELGLTLEQLQRPGDALAAFEVAAHLNPNEPKFHYALSRVRRRAGDIEGARLSLEHFHQLSGGQQGRPPK